MFTERELKLFHRVLRISSFCCVIPYDVSNSDTKTKRELQFCPSKTVFSKIYLGLCTFYTIFNTIRLLQMTIVFLKSEADSSIQIDDMALGAFFLIARTIHMLVHITMVYSTPEFAELLNQQIALNSRMGKN